MASTILLYNAGEYAELLGIPREYLWLLRKKGQVTTYRTKYHWADLYAWDSIDYRLLPKYSRIRTIIASKMKKPDE